MRSAPPRSGPGVFTSPAASCRSTRSARSSRSTTTAGTPTTSSMNGAIAPSPSCGRTSPSSRAKSRPCTPAPRRRASAGWRWPTRCSGIRSRSSRCCELLDGVAMDLEPVEIQDFAMLHQYCRYVAGGVGLMLGPVLGAAPVTFREAGVRLGIAMQLTNVLRDVGEDLANGRVYLPADELAAFGLSRAALETRRVTPAVPPLHAVAGEARAPLLRGWRPRGAPLSQRREPPHRAPAAANLCRHPRRHRADRLRRVPDARLRLDPRKLMVLGRAMWSERPWTMSQPSERSV